MMEDGNYEEERSRYLKDIHAKNKCRNKEEWMGKGVYVWGICT
jgi:hypothetical protein